MSMGVLARPYLHNLCKVKGRLHSVSSPHGCTPWNVFGNVCMSMQLAASQWFYQAACTGLHRMSVNPARVKMAMYTGVQICMPVWMRP